MRRVSAFTECVSRLDAFAFASARAFAASRTDPPSERRGAPHIAASSHERQDRRGAEGATDDARASRRAKTARRAVATSDKASTIRSRRARARPRATTRARTTRILSSINVYQRDIKMISEHANYFFSFILSHKTSIYINTR